MVKIITIIVCLSLGVAFNSYAHDSDRQDQLEKELQEIKEKAEKSKNWLEKISSDLNKLESRIGELNEVFSGFKEG